VARKKTYTVLTKPYFFIYLGPIYYMVYTHVNSFTNSEESQA